MPAFVRPVVNGVVGLILAIAAAQQVSALGIESFGPAGEHMGRSSDWPQGVEDVLRHPSRVYWNDVSGYEHAYYDGDVESINDLLRLFAKVDLTAHDVVILAGRPSAKSFHGKLTPYTVEFDLPGGISMWHIQRYSTTGLFTETPRLIVHVDEALAKRLDELKIPENVRLQESPYRVQDALAQVDAGNSALTARAIAVLGESGDSSPAVTEALTRAAADEIEYIREAAERALTEIEQANDPATATLRQQVAAFVSNHPQLLRTPEPAELLETLRKFDALYAEGFTAKGTLIQPALSGEQKLVAWTVTMGNERLVVQQLAVEDGDHAPTAGQLEKTTYIGPNQMAQIHRSRLWADGKRIETKPFTSFEPVGSTYDLLIGRVLWPLGRGFSRQIDRITQVAVMADGTLAVTAECDKDNLKRRWEMRIDPRADFLVRFAKAFRRDDKDPSFAVDNAGAMVVADRSTAHTARWTEGASARPVSISVNSVSPKTDDQLILRTEKVINEQPGPGQ